MTEFTMPAVSGVKWPLTSSVWYTIADYWCGSQKIASFDSLAVTWPLPPFLQLNLQSRSARKISPESAPLQRPYFSTNNILTAVGRNHRAFSWQFLAVPNEIKALLARPENETISCFSQYGFRGTCVNEMQTTGNREDSTKYALYWITSRATGPEQRLDLDKEAWERWVQADVVERENITLNTAFAAPTAEPDLQLWYVATSWYSLNATGWWKDVVLSQNESAVTETLHTFKCRIRWSMVLAWDVPAIPENATSATRYISGFSKVNSGFGYLNASMQPFSRGNVLLKVRNLTKIDRYDGGGPYRFSTCVDRTGPC